MNELNILYEYSYTVQLLHNISATVIDV